MGCTQSLAHDNLTDAEKQRGMTNGYYVEGWRYTHWVKVWPEWRDNEEHDRFWFKTRDAAAMFELSFRELGWSSEHGQEVSA